MSHPAVGLAPCFGYCAVSCLSIVLLTCIAVDISGLAIGLSYSNATCYANQVIMPLSSWLIGVCSVGIAIGCISFIIMILASCKLFANDTIDGLMVVIRSMPGIVFLGFAMAFKLIMNIIGMIELSYQFPSCKNEVYSVCAIMVIIIIGSMLLVFSKGYIMYRTAESNKKYDYVEV